VEVIVVVAVLIIAAAIVVPHVVSASHSKVTSAARVLASDLRVAQSLATTTQQPHTVLFSDDYQSYKVVADYAGEVYGSATAVEHPYKPGHLLEVEVAGLQGTSGVVVTAMGLGDGCVTFDSQGEPSEGGSVVLRAGSIEVTVTVEPLTGSVSVTETSG
jgi:type II secretory pathway pseudopilin PulG